MTKLSTVVANAEIATRSGEFCALAKCIAAGRGRANAVNFSASGVYGPRVHNVLKSAVMAGDIDEGDWGSELAGYRDLVRSFLSSLRSVGAFDRLLADGMLMLPLRTRIAVTTLGASAYIAGRGGVKPISALQLAGKQLDVTKAAAILVVSDELARSITQEAQALFRRELQAAVAAVTDAEFISIITSGISPISSGGSSSGFDVRQDLAAALGAITTSAASRLYILVDSITAKALAVKTNADGSAAFPAMTPQGGVIAGVPVVVSDGVVSGTVVVLDATGIAAGAGTVLLDASEHGALQMDSAPESPPTASAEMLSLWQHDLTALKAERDFGVERLRDSAVAVISGIGYSGGNSPPV